jgi:PKD repeat protein
MKHILYLILCLFVTNIICGQTWETDRAKLQSDGSLTYSEDTDRNRIPDFSHAGYRSGGVAIPDVPVRQTITPIEGDNTTHIQAAIDAVSALDQDSDGFRGAVLLEAGRYSVSGQIFIHTDGVVLRGIGDGRDTQDSTVIFGTGNIPNQRDLIVIGGGSETRWADDVPDTRQDITSDFVQIGSRSMDVEDGSTYNVGDNIIIFHPCTAEWLAAIDGGGTDDDASWSVGQYPIVYNRYITDISENTITVDAPVYNHLDRNLAQSFVYVYGREGLVTNVGIEDLNVQIESLGGSDENHIWNSIQFTQVEDAWVRNVTVSGFGLSGIRTSTASRISVINVHSVDPVAEVTGARMYNFNTYRNSNGILFDNCYARNGRHHYVSNGTSTASGVVVLRSVSEHPKSTSEGHRHWSTGMLFDNLLDIGTFPSSINTLAFYNRGDAGTGHGWSAAHSVMWNCEADRPGTDAGIIIEQPPTAQNYAIGCKGNLTREGPFNQPRGYIEGANNPDQLIPVSLYEAQLLDRTGTVISDFEALETVAAVGESITFMPNIQGNPSTSEWNFGEGATPSTITGDGPHQVSYASEGVKTITLTISNGTNSHSETKTAYVTIDNADFFAREDIDEVLPNAGVTTSVLDNDSTPMTSDNFSIELDGINDLVVYDATTILEHYPFSMMVWVKTTSNDDQTVLYNGNANSNVTGNTLSIRSGRATLESEIFVSSTTRETISDNNTINDGEWHHIAGVFTSPTERHLYVDGMLVASDDAPLENISGRLWRWSVGNRIDAEPDNDWVDGEVDEVRAYNSILTADQIQEVMLGGDCSVSDRLFYWNFDNQPTSTVQDEFNFFDGELEGGTIRPNDLPINVLEMVISDLPSNGTATVTEDLKIRYEPSENFLGMDSLTYTLFLGECDSTSATVIYEVTEDAISSTDNTSTSTQPIILYPNPTSGIIRINVDNIKRIQVYDPSGRYIDDFLPQPTINLSHLDDGVYIISIEDSKGNISSETVIKM